MSFFSFLEEFKEASESTYDDETFDVKPLSLCRPRTRYISRTYLNAASVSSCPIVIMKHYDLAFLLEMDLSCHCVMNTDLILLSSLLLYLEKFRWRWY